MSEPVIDGFRVRRRVQFYETDLAGIVHFSWLFRYMEEAEHALWRAAGLSIAPAGSDMGWPRVSASFDFQNPLYFEDEFEVAVRGLAVTRRTLQYTFRVTRDETIIGTGTLTAACVRKQAGAPMQTMDLPPEIVARLRAAVGPDLQTNASGPGRVTPRSGSSPATTGRGGGPTRKPRGSGRRGRARDR